MDDWYTAHRKEMAGQWKPPSYSERFGQYCEKCKQNHFSICLKNETIKSKPHWHKTQ